MGFRESRLSACSAQTVKSKVNRQSQNLGPCLPFLSAPLACATYNYTRFRYSCLTFCCSSEAQIGYCF
jgi:hypothetical protein